MEETQKKLPYEKAQMQVIEIQSEQFMATSNDIPVSDEEFNECLPI